MNKTKMSLTIIKLVGIGLILLIALLTIILIEALQIVSNLIQSLTEEKQIISNNQLLLKPVVPIRFPNSKPQWMIDLLPRDYLNINHLKEWAKQRRIKNYSKLSKAKLILALSPAV
jgi:hypothetical protein